MKNYNIYVDDQYMYTTCCNNAQQAEQVAIREAKFFADSFNQPLVNKHIAYKVVLTESDTIPMTDLIFDYIPNDSIGSTRSTGNGYM